MLDKKQKYLQIALNSDLSEARAVISRIPLDKRIIIEAGTPLIKTYGINGIKLIRARWEQRILGYDPEPYAAENESPLLNLLKKSVLKRNGNPAQNENNIFSPYIVADLKSMDRGGKEAEIAYRGGANAATVLGQAPAETLDAFIEKCEKYNLDAMVDMMNVEFPLSVLRRLKKLPRAVILHRGVDEESFNREKEIPFHEIQRIKDNYDIMVSVAGGDAYGEVRRAIFNDADIVVVWKSFYKSGANTAKLAEEFLKEIR